MGNQAYTAPNASVILDGDDTLWETQPLYEEAKQAFFHELALVGLPQDASERRLEAIDHANVVRLGFSSQRFPQSMYDTYQALCAEFAIPFDETQAQRVRSIGARVFTERPKITDGASDILTQLRRRGARLILATKGDREVQEDRLATSGLRNYFDRVYVYSNKTTKEFQQIVIEEEMDPSRGWSIGNSVKADINPALAVGLRAIWLRKRTWIYEDEEPAFGSRLYIAESIREVPDIIFGQRQ